MVDVSVILSVFTILVLILYMAFRITPLMKQRWAAYGEVYGFIVLLLSSLIILMAIRPQ